MFEFCFPVTIESKEEQAPLQELINNYSGHVDWSRRYGELGTQAQQLKAQEAKLKQDLQVVYTHLDNLVKSVNNGSAKEAIDQMVALTGKDPSQFWPKLYEQIAPNVDEYRNLDESQRQFLQEQQRVEFEKSQVEAERLKLQQQQQQAQVTQTLQQRMAQEGLSQEEVSQAYQELTAAVQQGQLPRLANCPPQEAMTA